MPIQLYSNCGFFRSHFGCGHCHAQAAQLFLPWPRVGFFPFSPVSVCIEDLWCTCPLMTVQTKCDTWHVIYLYYTYIHIYAYHIDPWREDEGERRRDIEWYTFENTSQDHVAIGAAKLKSDIITYQPYHFQPVGGGIATPLKNMKVIWDDDSQYFWKNKIHVPVTTNQYIEIQMYHL